MPSDEMLKRTGFSDNVLMYDYDQGGMTTQTQAPIGQPPQNEVS